MAKKPAKKPQKRSTRASAALVLPPVAPAAGKGLWIALIVSLSLHAVALSLHFKFPEAARAFEEKALDIILVNSKSAKKPVEAQALAQMNANGGGNTDQDRRIKTPLPPSAKIQEGTELEKAEKRIQALEAKQQRLLALARSKVTAAPATEQESQPEPTPVLSGRDLANNALAMARLEGEIAKNTDEYNKRPKLKTIGIRAEGVAGAIYMNEWERKVEKIGTLNFPPQAKGKFYGNLSVWVVLRADGSIYELEIRRSSGHKILDEAAKRIIEMGAPYGQIPRDFIGNYDTIGFGRQMTFLTSNQLEAQAK